MIKENKEFNKRQERRARQLGGDIMSYLYYKFEQIQEESGLQFENELKKGKRYYSVLEKGKEIKKGSFKTCMDFIVNAWKKATTKNK